MRRSVLTGLGALLAFAGAPAFAEPQIASCSRTEPSGERTLCHDALISAPVAEVWRLFSTSDGLRTWAAPVAAIDARTGGIFESSYNPAGRIGDAANIRNRIVVAESNRLLVMQVAAAPPGFAHETEVRQVTTVVEFTPIDAAHTRVRISMIGYREGEGFDAIYRFFDWGNAHQLAKLEQRVTQGSLDWRREAEQQSASSER